MQKAFAKIVERLEERTTYFSDCTKYGNKDEEQEEKSYSTMFMYEVADLVDDLIEIVNQVAEEYKSTEHINCSTDTSISHRNIDLVIDSSHRNEEVCEYKDFVENGRSTGYMEASCDEENMLSFFDVKDFKYCPYCGKKIKVV